MRTFDRRILVLVLVLVLIPYRFILQPVGSSEVVHVVHGFVAFDGSNPYT